MGLDVLWGSSFVSLLFAALNKLSANTHLSETSSGEQSKGQDSFATALVPDYFILQLFTEQKAAAMLEASSILTSPCSSGKKIESS